MAIAAVAIYGALAVTIQSGERVAFAAVWLTAALLALRSVGQPLPGRAALLVAGWFVSCGVYLAVAALQPQPAPGFIVGDLALALFPLLHLLAYAVRPDWMTDRRPLVVLLALLALAAVAARQFGMLGSRHEAPSSLLIAGAWYFALRGRTSWVRLIAGAVVLGVGLLANSSGYRTHLALWALAPVLILLFTGARRAVAGLACVGVIAGLGAWMLHVDVDPIGTLEESRYQTLLTGRPDESLSSRALEMRDVRETMADEFLPGQIIVGHGFGATYEPHWSPLERNAGADGRVHNVHFGPGLAVFRFGLFGLAAFAAMVWLAAKMLRRVGKADLPEAVDTDLVGVWALALLLFSVEFMTLNSTVQPAMSWCLGGLLVAHFVARRTVAPQNGYLARATVGSGVSGSGLIDDCTRQRLSRRDPLKCELPSRRAPDEGQA